MVSKVHGPLVAWTTQVLQLFQRYSQFHSLAEIDCMLVSPAREMHLGGERHEPDMQAHVTIVSRYLEVATPRLTLAVNPQMLIVAQMYKPCPTFTPP